MKGYFRKRGEKWSFTVDVGRDIRTGKRIQKTHSGYKTKKEAQAACAELIAQVSNGVYVPTSKQQLSSYLDQWLKLYCEPKLRETTIINYRRAIKIRINPFLGQIRIDKLTAAHGQAFVEDMQKDNLSARYIEYCFTILKEALNKAVEWELLNKNPVQFVEIPRPRRKKEHNTWSIKQVNQFLTFAKYDNPIYYYVFLLAIYTGMRRGELLALKWKNINLDDGMISVYESLVYNEEGFSFSDVKTTSSRRTVKIDEEVCKEMKQYRKLQNEFKLSAGDLYDDLGLVFCREDGRPIYPRTLATIFDRVTKKAKVPKIRFHDLRHTFATISLELGIPAKVVQEALGHSSIQTTMDTYSHVTPNMQNESATTYSNALRGLK